MTDEKIEAVTSEDVERAEQEIRDAEAALTEVERQIAEGDETVTMDEMVAKRHLVDFLQQRATGRRHKAEMYRRQVRLQKAQDLHDRASEFGLGSGKHIADLGRAIRDAEEALRTAVEEHNATIGAWIDEAKALEVGRWNGAPVPPAAHGRLAVDEHGGLHVGRRVLTRFDAESFIRGLRGTADDDALYASLEKIDAEIPEPSPSTRHFRSLVTGVVHTYDHQPSEDTVKNGQLVEISRKEAWNE